jgi:hypothetical protein
MATETWFSDSIKNRAALVETSAEPPVTKAQDSVGGATRVAGADIGAAGRCEQPGPWHGWPGAGCESELDMGIAEWPDGEFVSPIRT